MHKFHDPKIAVMAALARATGARMETGTLERPKAHELRASAMEVASKLRELRSKEADKRGDTWQDEVRVSTAQLIAIDAEERIVSRAEEMEMRQMRWDTDVAEEADRLAHPEKYRGKGPAAATGDLGNRETRSAGEIFATSPEFRAWVESSGGNGTSPGVQAEVRTLITTSQTDTPEGGLFMPRGTPYLGNIDRRRLFVRQLLPNGNTELNSVPYIREVSPRSQETQATAVAEATAKPEVQMQFVEADAIVRKIAAWVPVTNEILADAPTLRSYIDARLGYMLLVCEENQILNGTGSGADLRGIRQTTGLQTQAAIAGDFPATLGSGIGLIENVDLEADGVAINPLDYWTMLVTRHSTRFDGQVTAVLGQEPSPFGAPNFETWGLPTVRTRAMPQGKALLGAWRLAAQILDREGITMKTSDSHVDYFINNKVAILVEERLALPVYRPDGFVEVTLTA